MNVGLLAGGARVGFWWVFCLVIFGWRRSPVCPCSLYSRDWGLRPLTGVVPISIPGSVPVSAPRSPGPVPALRGSAHPHGRGSALQPALPAAANGSERIALRPLQYSWEYSLYCNCALCYFICFYKLDNTIMIQWYHSEPHVKKSKCSCCDWLECNPYLSEDFDNYSTYMSIIKRKKNGQLKLFCLL